MDKLAKLMQDIAILWDKYHPMYLRGMLSTLGLALAATAIGCIIGLACGILNTIKAQGVVGKVRQGVEDEDGLQHHGRAAEDLDVDADDDAEKFQ